MVTQKQMVITISAVSILASKQGEYYDHSQTGYPVSRSNIKDTT
jgi:hypothetical protein